MISHDLEQELLELVLIVGYAFVQILHKGYTSFSVVICDKKLVDYCCALPVIISVRPCFRVQT